MAIETTTFAQVNISVSPTGVQGGNFGILGFLTDSNDQATNPILPAERGRSYTSLASVGGDWSTDSEVYKAATAFYAQTPTPTDFTVLMNFATDQPAVLIGGTHSTAEELVALGAGTFDITIDGIAQTVGVDFTGISGSTEKERLESAAVLVSAEITGGASCNYGRYGFVITSPGVGLTSTITPAYGEGGDALGLSAHLAKAGDGILAESAVDSLATCLTAGIDFVGLVTHKKWRDVLSGADGDTTAEIAFWAEAAKKIFCNTSNSLAVLNSGLNTDIASVLKAGTYRFTMTTFSKNPAKYVSASIFGRAAAVNFEGVDTTITLNLKQAPGIDAEDLTPAEFATLRSKFASAVVQIGTGINARNAFTDSRMASGSWLDTTHGLLWLENRCEVDQFNLLYVNNTKIPYTQVGINTSAAVLEKSLDTAVRNGLAGPGFLPDGTFLSKGYRVNVVPLENVASSDKSNRVYRGLSFDMVGAGALHEIEVNGNFSE